MSKRTPGPWFLEDDCIRAKTSDSGTVSVAVCRGWDTRWEKEQKANAEFIVRACNAHDDLLAALEGFLAAREKVDPEHLFDDAEIIQARAAIAKAKS